MLDELFKDRYVLCSQCDSLILVHSYKYNIDECYEIEPDEVVCEDCILDYIKKYKK